MIACALVAACGRPAKQSSDTVAFRADSVVVDTTPPAVDTNVPPPRIPPSETSPHHRALSPLADSISQRLVIVPTTESWFTAAARGKRMLVDIGRVDLDVAKPPSRLAAFREAVAARTPLPVGTRLRLRGPWGADDVEIAGFDVWNGRIAATLKATSRVDSLARTLEPLIAAAQRLDSAASARDTVSARDTTCARDTVETAFNARLDALRDSVLQVLHGGEQPVYPRLIASLRAKSTRATGCFGAARAILVVALVAGDYEWVRERVFIVAPTGKASPIAMRDFRFRSHDLLEALDADEDGTDEVAARGYTERAGATVILRLVEGKRLERVTSGFAWER